MYSSLHKQAFGLPFNLLFAVQKMTMGSRVSWEPQFLIHCNTKLSLSYCLGSVSLKAMKCLITTVGHSMTNHPKKHLTPSELHQTVYIKKRFTVKGSKVGIFWTPLPPTFKLTFKSKTVSARRPVLGVFIGNCWKHTFLNQTSYPATLTY